MTTRSKKLLYIFLFCIWLAVINMGRGSGIGMMKPFEIVFMVWFAVQMTPNKWAWLLYPSFIAGMFMIGTGELMPILNPIVNSWRFWEAVIPTVWTLLFWVPLWLRKVI